MPWDCWGAVAIEGNVRHNGARGHSTRGKAAVPRTWIINPLSRDGDAIQITIFNPNHLNSSNRRYYLPYE